ncbi:MAG: hypothetical protein AAFX94_15965, partial [Myxococcota bacterium]
GDRPDVRDHNLRQVPASVVLGLRASPTMGASYASAVGTFNGLLSQGARIKRAGVFISRLNPNDLTVHQALESVAVAAGTDLLVAPITELVGVGAPALIGTGLGEAYRPLAEAIRDRALDEQRQATPVKVGLGDLATAFQQSGKQIAAQSTQEAFPADASAAASQYTYVLDSQALADVVGSAAAPVVSHSASSAGFRGSSPAPLPSASEHSPTPAVAIQPSVPEAATAQPIAAQPYAAQPFAAPAVATQPLAPEPSVNELSTVVADGVESPANIDIETAIEAEPSARRPSRFRLLAAGGALAAVVALAFVLFGRAATSSEAGAVMPSDPRSAETSVAEPPSTDPEPADDSNGPDEPESISEADGPEFELDVPEEPAPKRKKRRRRRAKGEVKR